MQLFIDSANIVHIREIASLGILDGVTTNPSLIAKEKGGFDAIIGSITAAVHGPISVECVSERAEQIVPEAERIAARHPDIVVKVPITEEGLKAVHRLSQDGIRTNVTLVFSVHQAILAAKAGATYVSPFVGRLDDIGEDGMQVVADIKAAFSRYGFPTMIIVASVRNLEHVRKATLLGADVVTVPYTVIKEMVRHPLTDAGIAKFLDDWKKVKR
ncbi:fructose-6-phosphate aldolase [Candidatus Woesearchaeota archaeon]|nr:fructose-6-phosphate aldolase [Candidatus Woesearchaeota archaeon]